ncbi:hypothetical protein [Bacillus sp. PS06]|uniref:hypothetical protein n=1 Tax=Bacillus sp. PS06 TaxID=2764176 RepID=UPI00177DF2CE|nr:hypothetical protein [Bacillus sp. PS06]MBD8069433.1 hypothetical protein [Bacillus sp. PS06]
MDVAYPFIQRNQSGIQRTRAIIRRKKSMIQRTALDGCSISNKSTKSRWNPTNQGDNPTKEEPNSMKGS